jgi:diguanylate cyclase (GGDEF)-like protein
VAQLSGGPDRPSLTLARLEPVVPLFLGLHGLAISALDQLPAGIALAFAGVTALGLVGLAGWVTPAAVAMRAAACLVVALGLQLAEPELVPSMLQWYYCVAAVYSLLLTGRRAAAIGPLSAACYFVQVLLGSGVVPLEVAALRCGVLCALGLVMYFAGVAYRRQRDEARVGREHAELVSLELAHAATHDALTDLPNREQFLATLQGAIDAPERAEVAVLVLDIDRFKSVNDALGHASGDRMLVEVGRRLDAWRPDRTLGAQVLGTSRLGGDGFGVLLAASPDEARAASQRLLRAFDDPFVIDGRSLSVSISIGMAHADRPGCTASELLRSADIALFEAKGAGRNRVTVHVKAMSQSTDRTLDLEQDLRAAVRAGSITSHYQPIVDIASGETVGVEALARWSRDHGGPVPPDVFIPIAEDLGLIGHLGAQVLVDALDNLTAWRRSGLRLQYVAVNVSPLQLRESGFAEMVADLLDERDLPAGSLVLEVTEGAVMHESADVTATLERLRAIGVTLSMDDFGTGYSSLTRLRMLPVTELKIDRSFINELPRDETLPRIVLELASLFGLHTVAEGVETAEQLATLRALGCHAAQGYYLSRPVPASEIPALLTSALAAS